MKEYKAGTYILHKGYKPFNPSFINDDIDWKLDELAPLLQDASLWLGKLNTYADLIPNIEFFIKMYATKEALILIELKAQGQLLKTQLHLLNKLNQNCVMIGMKFKTTSKP